MSGLSDMDTLFEWMDAMSDWKSIGQLAKRIAEREAEKREDDK